MPATKKRTRLANDTRRRNPARVRARPGAPSRTERPVANRRLDVRRATRLVRPADAPCSIPANSARVNAVRGHMCRDTLAMTASTGVVGATGSGDGHVDDRGNPTRRDASAPTPIALCGSVDGNARSKPDSASSADVASACRARLQHPLDVRPSEQRDERLTSTATAASPGRCRRRGGARSSRPLTARGSASEARWYFSIGAAGSRPERELRAAERVLGPPGARARVQGQGRSDRGARRASQIGDGHLPVAARDPAPELRAGAAHHPAQDLAPRAVRA